MTKLLFRYRVYPEIEQQRGKTEVHSICATTESSYVPFEFTIKSGGQSTTETKVPTLLYYDRGARNQNTTRRQRITKKNNPCRESTKCEAAVAEGNSHEV